MCNSIDQFKSGFYSPHTTGVQALLALAGEACTPIAVFFAGQSILLDE